MQIPRHHSQKIYDVQSTAQMGLSSFFAIAYLCPCLTTKYTSSISYLAFQKW